MNAPDEIFRAALSAFNSRNLFEAERLFKEFRILASQTVIDMFLEEESQSLAMLSDFIGKPVSLAVETVHNQEQYDIILM